MSWRVWAIWPCNWRAGHAPQPRGIAWTAPVPQADVRLGRQLQSIEQLQLQIGKFVSETSRGAMHKEVATQLPELLRIATYFDTLARVMHHVGVQGNHTPRADESPGLSLLILPGMPERAPGMRYHRHRHRGLRGAGLHGGGGLLCRRRPGNPQQAQGGPWLAGEAVRPSREAYQTAKAALLHQAREAGSMSMRCTTGCHGSSDLRRAVEQG